jgi:ribosomal protein L16 Arg81 hydroxylase
MALLNGSPMVDVLAELSSQGFPEDESVRFCAGLYDDPAFDAGQWLAERLRVLESMLFMRDQMRRLSDEPSVIDRRSELSASQFLNEYYARNTPVILTDVCDKWAARELWSPDYLVDILGGTEVEVMADRNADPNYEINADHHKFVMPFDEYVAKIEAADRSNDLYLVANNKLLAMPAARPLWDDFGLDRRYLRVDENHSQAFLWFGAAGTVTPLHFDTVNVLFNQIDGWKHFTIIPPLQMHRVYNHLAVYSEVDPREPDLERYPRFTDIEQVHVDIGPGESLFIPSGWWHHVESLELSISLSFTNFAFPNSIDWAHPTIVL